MSQAVEHGVAQAVRRKMNYEVSITWVGDPLRLDLVPRREQVVGAEACGDDDLPQVRPRLLSRNDYVLLQHLVVREGQIASLEGVNPAKANLIQQGNTEVSEKYGPLQKLRGVMATNSPPGFSRPTAKARNAE